jgi:DNA primase
MKRSGLDYPEAVREVARRSGITVPEQTSRAGPDPREPLFGAVAAAHDWFTRQLRESPEAEGARKYLMSRGLDLDTVGPYELGYAPRSPTFEPAMRTLGIGQPVLLEAGLMAKREDGTIVPRFRGRLLFPIHELRGRVVGFGGRLLGPGEPKYLNSPESPIFRKGHTLYNLHQARGAIRKEEQVILVEGYFDVLRLVLAGCEQVVAPLGTSLTPDQAALLRRFTTNAVVLFDSDMPGLRATFRAADELLRHGVRVRVATLPEGEDPDTLVRSGGLEALKAVLKDDLDVMERKIQLLERKGWFSDVRHQREALDRLLPTVRATKDPVQRELYLSLVERCSGVKRQVLEGEVASLPEPAPRPVRPPEPPELGPRREWGRTERKMLQLFLSSDYWRAAARRDLTPELFEEPVNRRIFELLAASGTKGPLPPPDDLPEPVRERWQSYLDSGPPVAESAMDQFFLDGRSVLEARPYLRRLIDLGQRLHQAAADERDALLGERQQLRALVEQKYPIAFRAYYPLIRSLKRGSRRPPPDSPAALGGSSTSETGIPDAS